MPAGGFSSRATQICWAGKNAVQRIGVREPVLSCGRRAGGRTAPAVIAQNGEGPCLEGAQGGEGGRNHLLLSSGRAAWGRVFFVTLILHGKCRETSSVTGAVFSSTFKELFLGAKQLC